mmetsp:Transcript_113183/g.316261  ORF Transcript_113183/g.316261 Transcript_113183/m.316261 type:complete len:211 (-) Transcript_113183:53-685(-)
MAELLPDPAHLLLGLRRFDKDDVGARLGEGAAPPDGLVQAQARARVRARDDQKVRAPPGLHRDPDPCHRLLDGHDLAPRSVPALLRELLVLQLYCRGPSCLVAPHRVRDVQKAAEARVRVADERREGQPREGAHPLHHLPVARDAGVRHPQVRAHRAEARHVEGLEVDLLRDLQGHAVEDPRRDQQLALPQQRLQAGPRRGRGPRWGRHR